jgi:hypothetical protein
LHVPMDAKKAVHGEVPAMGVLESVLEPLGPDERGRVLRWAAERFGVPTLPGSAEKQQKTRLTGTEEAGAPDLPDDVGEFFAQASPTSESLRALALAYWVQERQGKGEFDSQSVNDQLKHLGHGVSNITRALDDLKRRRPQLVIQIEKKGKTKQARKKYKVTAAGKTEVERMVAGQSEP